MNKNEIKKEYHKMIKQNEPEIWDKIESQLEEKDNTFEQKNDQKVIPLRKNLMRAVAVCAGFYLIVFAGATIGNMTKGRSIQLEDQKISSYQDGYVKEMYSEDAYSEAGYEEVGYVATDTGATYSTANGAGAMESNTKYTADSNSMEGVQQQNNRKLIKRVTLDVEAVEFDAFLEEIKKQTDLLDGYMETFDVSSREYANSRYKTATIVLRIPCEKSAEILESIGNEVNVLSQSENVEDVTLTYVDLESHIKSLEIEKEQLLTLLENAESVEEMITIQSHLADVRYELESYASQLKTYENLITYDTITLYVKEVVKETPTGETSILKQMKEGFSQTLDQVKEDVVSFAIWFVSSIPYFVIFGILIFVVVVIIRKIRRR